MTDPGWHTPAHPLPHQNGLCSSAQRELFSPCLDLFVLLPLSPPYKNFCLHWNVKVGFATGVSYRLRLPHLKINHLPLHQYLSLEYWLSKMQADGPVFQCIKCVVIKSSLFNKEYRGISSPLFPLKISSWRNKTFWFLECKVHGLLISEAANTNLWYQFRRTSGGALEAIAEWMFLFVKEMKVLFIFYFSVWITYNSFQTLYHSCFT